MAGHAGCFYEAAELLDTGPEQRQPHAVSAMGSEVCTALVLMGKGKKVFITVFAKCFEYTLGQSRNGKKKVAKKAVAKPAKKKK